MKYLIILLCFFSLSFAHPGRTNADGCHTNRKTGDYHCHNSGNRVKKTMRTRVVAKPLVAQQSQKQVREISCKAIGITDGDTFTCLTTDKRQIKVRLAQIDAPEQKQPFYNRSKQMLSQLIFDQSVKLTNLSQDRYKRTVATVWLNDVDICLEMVKRGKAWVYPKYAKEQHYFDAEIIARNNSQGLWKQNIHQSPWEWRQLSAR